MLKMDGYDDCILSICYRFGSEPCVAYDYDKVIAKLMADGMTQEEAIEWYGYNMIGSYVGETTPVFVEVTQCLPEC